MNRVLPFMITVYQESMALGLSFQCTLPAIDCFLFIYAVYIGEICPEMHTTTKMAKMAKFRQQQLGGQCQ